MNRLTDVVIAILLIFSLSQIVIIEAKSKSKRVRRNVVSKSVRQNATTSLSTSPWLKKLRNHRKAGCWGRAWICRQGYYPPTVRRLCCRNQCIDVFSDVNNCGFCKIRCPFSWQCCRGQCVNTNFSLFHCGRCFNRCPWQSRCVYGMCGYAQPPRPRPPWPCPPFPFPPKPPKPHPPRPPHPPKDEHPPTMIQSD